MKNTAVQFIDNTLSTNKLLSEMARRGMTSGTPLPEFYALAAGFQTGGRGMGHNTWFSSKGENILLSLYFTPELEAAGQFAFNIYFSLATLDFISRYTGHVQIKWPNDIYAGGKKIAGDLTEHNIRGNNILYTVVGIGINVNQSFFPAGIPHPTSLYLETHRRYQVRKLTEEFVELLQRQYAVTRFNDMQALRERYLQNLYQLGETCLYLIKGKETEAVIRDIDPYGRIVLTAKNGRTHVCGFKEIVFLQP